MKTQWIVATGFSRGIGFELAKLIHAQNFKILHIGRKACGFEDELEMCDLAQPRSSTWINSLNLKLKNKNIVGFFYGAGILPMLKYKEDDFDQISNFWESQAKAMQVNYISCAQLAEQVLPFILESSKISSADKKEQDEDRDKPFTILNTIPFVAHFSSIAALDPFPGLEFYGITKLATLKYFENLAKRFDPTQLLCLSLHPGTVKTDMLEDIVAVEPYQDLPLVKLFKKVMEKGQIISAEQSAQSVADFLFNANYEAMRKESHGKLYLADKQDIYTHRK